MFLTAALLVLQALWLPNPTHSLTHTHTHSLPRQPQRQLQDSEPTPVKPFFQLPRGVGRTDRPLLAPTRARVRDDVWGLEWPDKRVYYYTHVKHRVEQIASPSCASEISYLTGTWGDENELLGATPSLTHSASSSAITVMSLTAADSMKQFWQQIPPPTQMRSDVAMCNDTWYHKKSLFKESSVAQSLMCKKSLIGSAPRCQSGYLERNCWYSMADIESTALNRFYIPEANHMTTFNPPEPYLIRVKNARVGVCGQVSLACGALIPFTLCDRGALRHFGKLFHETCKPEAKDYTDSNVSSSCSEDSPYGPTLQAYDRVFVVAQPDDGHIYHVQIEVVPKIAYHLDFLISNPDIKILIGCDLSKPMSKESKRKSIRFQKLALLPMMELLGLSMDRFIFKTNVIAKEVYIPSEGACQDPVHNTWQLMTMRHMILNKLNLHSGLHSFDEPPSEIEGQSSSKSQEEDDDHHDETGNGNKKPVMLLIKRSKKSTSTRQRKDGFRQWGDAFTSNIMISLKEAFPQYQVKLYSDMDRDLMGSFTNQVSLFHKADIVIGVHGAGLGHMLYMKPNSIVVEIAPSENDGRLHLGGGPFNRLATLLAHNYLVHYPKKSELKFVEREIEFDIQRMVTNIKSFVTSLS